MASYTYITALNLPPLTGFHDTLCYQSQTIYNIDSKWYVKELKKCSTCQLVISH